MFESLIIKVENLFLFRGVTFYLLSYTRADNIQQ